VNPEEIEQSFTSAGWAIDDGFSDDLVIGYKGDGLSILAHKEMFESDGGLHFELLDHIRNVAYWVQDIPTPQRGAELLQEHGEPPEE
jgi:hypothetical protein